MEGNLRLLANPLVKKRLETVLAETNETDEQILTEVIEDDIN